MFSLAEIFAEQGELIAFNVPYQNELKTIKMLHALPASKRQRFNGLTLRLLNNLDKSEQLKQKQEACAERSRFLREEGNQVYKTKYSRKPSEQAECLLAACRLYTRAILAAENAFEQLCLGYANRGMALQDYGYYAQAYDDCATALEFGYPLKLQQKLIMRQAYCARQLQDVELLAVHVSQLEQLQLNPSYRQQLEQLQQQLALLQGAQSLQQPQEQSHEAETKTHKIMADSESKERRMIATKRIDPGQLIFTEHAECFVPIEKQLICQQCGASLMCAPIPCPACHQRVVYCSRRCRQLQSLIHGYECAGYRWDLLRMLGVAHLAMRMVLTYLPQWLQQLPRAGSRSTALEIWQLLMCLAAEQDSSVAANEENSRAADEYSSLAAEQDSSLAAVEDSSLAAPQSLQSLRMITHLHKLPAAELIYHTLCANLLQVYLHKCTNFFDQLQLIQNFKIEDCHMLIAALILRCAGQLLVNGHVGHAILPGSLAGKEFALLQPKLWQRPYQLKLGCLHKFSHSSLIMAINLPHLSLCNHACAASLRTSFNGQTVCNFAAQNIQAGAEIYNCYTMDYRNSMCSQRQEQLQHTYKFRCGCIKCLRAQPDQDYLQFHRYRCEWLQCGKSFVPLQLPHQSSLSWWLHPEEHVTICCTVCERAQPAAWYDQFLELLERCHQTQARRDLYRAFDSLKTWLLDYHGLKLSLAKELLEACFAAKEDGCVLNPLDYDQLTHIAQFLLAGTAAQFDQNSVEYISKLSYLWDLIAWGVHKCEAQELKRMRASLEYLGSETKQIYVNYYNEFIEQQYK